jgi:hypothetical protein
VFFVDWPGACTGAAWVDVVAMLPSIALEGGGAPTEVFATTPASRRADPDAVTTAVAVIGGYFVRTAGLPAPPGLPTLRAFQAAQGEVTMAWLRERLAVRDRTGPRANLSG